MDHNTATTTPQGGRRVTSQHNETILHNRTARLAFAPSAIIKAPQITCNKRRRREKPWGRRESYIARPH
ncbi:hypothetical protein E2C01_067301 [Portunus trituberculatus]|uniref:Uncharacterized protein n=1 Tax=Portunus trituberculatus TaxID=210409 RepID=A0A5B7HTA0_PORTR|nr:hypothetical protein [Portunus trituberculatus]